MAHEDNSKEKIVFVGDSRVRRGNGFVPPPDYSAYPGKSEAFIPNFLLKEWMVGVVVLVGILVLTISEPAPLGFPANPGATVIPVPDWYFLFLYQYLKLPYASGIISSLAQWALRASRSAPCCWLPFWIRAENAGSTADRLLRR